MGVGGRLVRLIAVFAALAVAGPAHAESRKLEVGYIPILASAPLFVLDGAGWAKAEGLDLKLTRFESGPAAIQALAAGQVDVVYGGVSPVLVARSKGVDVSVVANSAVEELAVVARGDLAPYVAKYPPAEAFARFAADKGRKVKIGTQPQGSVPDTILRHWLTKVLKIAPDAVDVLGMGIEKTQQALLSGAIDAATIREPTVTIVKELDPSATVVALGGDMFPRQPGTVVAVRGEVIKQNPDLVQKLVSLHVKAQALIHANPAQAAKFSHEYLGKGLIELSTLEKAITSPSSKFTADPHALVQPLERLTAFQVETGASAVLLPVAEAFDFRFYDAAVK